MALRTQVGGELIARMVDPVGRALARLHLTPNAITTMGIVLTGIAAWFVAQGEHVLGGWILVFGGLSDTFDGAVARARGMITRWGGFYDSVSDRLTDGTILAALAWSVRDQPRIFALVAVALVTALVTSYVRAKAESMDLDCAVGLVERGERSILVMVSLVITPLFEAALWLLAVGGVVTVLQRIHHVHGQLADAPSLHRAGA